MPYDSPKIVPLDPALVEATNRHLGRHVLESGRHGIHWLPYDPKQMAEPPRVRADALDLDYQTVGWGRWYVVTVDADNVVGHLSLKGGKFDRGLHRCELGMGLEHPYRQQGLGTQLMTLAIGHAKATLGIDWLDLRVLSLNTPGIHLYLQHGFEEVSRIPDFCRIDGQAADDLFMSIWVGEPIGD